jgi:phosphoribosylformylglycinamidine synthase
VKKIRYNIITFPGTNCDNDIHWIAQLHGGICEYVWHKETKLKNPDIVILPGGFSFGDRSLVGSIASLSPVMTAVKSFAKKGGLVLGICNGFQILVAAGMLPGSLLTNIGGRFICHHQYIKVTNNETAFSHLYKKEEVVDIPVSHKNGRYHIDKDGLKDLQENGQIVFRYSNLVGCADYQVDPNGSDFNIAGIINKKGNVLGMMPHPERSADSVLPTDGGTRLFLSIKSFLEKN